MPDTVTVPGTLSGHARAIWRAAFLGAYDGTCSKRSDKDACAASIAWAAVKNDYRKNADGEWVRKSIIKRAEDAAMTGPMTPPDTGEYPQLPTGQERSQKWRDAFNAALLGECASAPDPTSCAMEAANRAERDDRFTGEGKMMEERRLIAPALMERAAAAGIVGSVVERKDYSPEKRAEFADKGWALPDGSYPIADVGDLKDAIQAFGRANESDQPRVRALIRRRAKELGALDQVSSEWGGKEDEPAEKSLSAIETIRAAQASEDRELIESGMGNRIAQRPKHINSNDWMARPLRERTIAHLVIQRAIERTYEESVERTIAEGWQAIANPSRAGEVIFQRWIDAPDGMLLQRSVLVRKSGTTDWRLRELTRGASMSWRSKSRLTNGASATTALSKMTIAPNVHPSHLVLRGLPASLTRRGGPGSGHFGHAGRPGERGGSAPGEGDSGKPPFEEAPHSGRQFPNTPQGELGNLMPGPASGYSGHPGRPGQTGGAQPTSARVSVRGHAYEGKPGFLISGKDTKGRGVSIFEENQALAEAYARNIKAGREYNQGRPIDEALSDARDRASADYRVVPAEGGNVALMLGDDRTLISGLSPDQLSMALDAKNFDPWVRDLTGGTRRYRLPSSSEL